MKYTSGWSSHLPVLVKVLRVTKGAVLELGIGMFSTPLLHWVCADEKRELVSYESSKRYFRMNDRFDRGLHKMILVKDWDKIEIERPWDMVFVDHEADRRRIEIKRLADYAQYIIVHDTQPKEEHRYRYHEVFPLFKYQRDFTFSRAWTTVLSNFNDLSQLDA